METKDTTEGITKFLRSKDHSVEIILSTASSLIRDELQVYFPGKTRFVFELLCDRLNDFSTPQFKRWKYNTQAWSLLGQVWQDLSKDEVTRSIRNRTFKKVKLIDLFVDLFKHNSPTDLINVAFEVIQQIIKEIYIEMDNDLSISLLSSYARYIKSAKFTDEWTSIIERLYLLPQSSVKFKLSKKSTAKFFREALPSTLNFITSTESCMTTKILNKILKQVVLDKENISHLESNTNQMLNSTIETPSLESLRYLFSLIISHLSNKDISLCEKLYHLLTSKESLHDLAEPLLKTLADANMPLSGDFFLSIYDKQINMRKPIDVNWALVNYLIKVGVEMAIEKAEQILTIIPVEAIERDIALSIGESLAEVYINAREVPQFFHLIWPKAIANNKIWSSEDYMNIIASKIDRLTEHELKSILDIPPLEKKAVATLVISVVKGLLKNSFQKQNAIKSLILDNSALFIDTDWKLYYYLLCIYGDECISRQNIAKQLKNNHSDNYYYYCVLRFLELTGSKKEIGDFQFHFLEFLKENPQEYEFIFKRWVIVINNYFSKEEIQWLVGSLFDLLKPEDLTDLFHESNSIIFEQDMITDAVLLEVSKRVNLDPKSLSLLHLIPIQCFGKRIKKKLIEQVYLMALDPESEASQDAAINSLGHHLSQPSFTSSIETNFINTLKLVNNTRNDLKDKSLKIFRTIWQNHLHHYGLAENQGYITSSFKILWKYYDTVSESQFSAELGMSLEILQLGYEFGSTDDSYALQYKELGEKFVKVVVNSLVEITSNNRQEDYVFIEWLLNTLYELKDHNSTISSDVLRSSKSLGLNLSVSKDSPELNSLRKAVFGALSKFMYPTFDNSVYLLALFISLEKYYTDNKDVLKDFLSRLSSLRSDEYFETYDFLLYSLREANTEDINTLITVLNAIILCLPKDYTENSISNFVESLTVLLLKADFLNEKSRISIIFTLTKLLTEKTWLFTQYALESTIGLLTKFTSMLNDGCSLQLKSETYKQITKATSSVLLFHRFKLSSRNHILIKLCAVLLEVLSLKSGDTTISRDVECASAYSRLLTNICEPSKLGRESLSNALNSTSAAIRRTLRKHLHVLLLNFIYYSLNYNFDQKVIKIVTSGIYSVLDVLSAKELNLLNASLDGPGRIYFKTLYSEYKSFGKWKDD
ncbi:uncharacterized protein PRCAT00002855001 [Priceomyces carsonii]|uniref:uncharacterized protein n=1 Tax=Priceomyces carsonii TaxID=28549 RepID=UPI002EDB8BF3|nr:unnamed protein product [Priceomyces carsonii]